MAFTKFDLMHYQLIMRYSKIFKETYNPVLESMIEFSKSQRLVCNTSSIIFSNSRGRFLFHHNIHKQHEQLKVHQNQ